MSGEVGVQATASEGWQLLERGIELGLSGKARQARICIEAAEAWAVAHGDSELADRAFCNGAGSFAHRVDLQLAGRLRDVLNRTTVDETRFLAAYNLAVLYERLHASRKTRFYALIARDLARRLGRREWTGWSENNLGLSFLAESRLPQARASFRRALTVLGDRPRERIVVTQNLGYCRLLAGDVSGALDLLERCQRELSESGLEDSTIHLDLAHAYLQSREPERGRRHGRRAQRLAEREGDPEAQRNAIFLLAEAAVQLGDQAAGERAIDELRSLFPDNGLSLSLLQQIDLLSLINLRA